MPEVKRGTFRWVPVEQVTNPPPNVHLEHLGNMWWVTNGRGEVPLYAGWDGRDYAPCNRDRSIAERIVASPHGEEIGATGVLYIEHAFLSDSPGRY